jgi:hypothetical protein
MRNTLENKGFWRFGAGGREVSRAGQGGMGKRINAEC